MGETIQKTREEVLKEYQQIVTSYEAIMSNKKIINNQLQDCVVGVPIGEDVYGTVSSLNGPDISLPNATEGAKILKRILIM